MGGFRYLSIALESTESNPEHGSALLMGIPPSVWPGWRQDHSRHSTFCPSLWRAQKSIQSMGVHSAWLTSILPSVWPGWRHDHSRHSTSYRSVEVRYLCTVKLAT